MNSRPFSVTRGRNKRYKSRARWDQIVTYKKRRSSCGQSEMLTATGQHNVLPPLPPPGMTSAARQLQLEPPPRGATLPRPPPFQHRLSASDLRVTSAQRNPSNLVIRRAVGEARDARPAVGILRAVDNLLFAVVEHALERVRIGVLGNAGHARYRRRVADSTTVEAKS